MSQAGMVGSSNSCNLHLFLGLLFGGTEPRPARYRRYCPNATHAPGVASSSLREVPHALLHAVHSQGFLRPQEGQRGRRARLDPPAVVGRCLPSAASGGKGLEQLRSIPPALVPASSCLPHRYHSA